MLRPTRLAVVLALCAIAGVGFPPVALGSEQLEEQLDIRPNNATQGQARDVADQLLRLGAQERQAGQYQRAIAAWYQAIEIYNALGDMTSAGIAYDFIGLTHTQLGQFGAAEDTLRRRLAVAQDNRDFIGQVRGWNNLGSLFVQRGQLLTAQDAFQTALDIAVSLDDHGGIGLSLSNLGLVAQSQGNLQDALKYYEAATEYRFRAGDLVGEANSSNNLGAIYARLGQEGSALGAYLVARDAAQRGGDLSNWLRSLDGLIDIYLGRRDAIQVQRFVAERVNLTNRSTVSAFQRFLTLVRLGEYYTLTEDRAAAIATYEQALVLARQLEENSWEGALMNRLQSLRQGA
jgi:tetratricopeptide (TPR) repeat protein